jgi:outer membrane protein TolC
MTVRIILAAAFLAASFPIAASAAPMTLTDAVAFALDHTPAVASKVAAVRAAEHTVAIQRGVAFPVVDGQLINSSSKSSNYQGAYGVIGLSPQNEFSQNTAQIGTNYTLYSGGLAYLQLTSARASLAQAQEDLANTEDQIATNVTNAYFTVVQKTSIVTVDESDLSYQDALVVAAKAKEKAGVAAGVDVLKAQVAQNKSASTLVGARADVDNARELLAQTIGAPLDQQFVFPAAVPQPPLPNEPVATLQDVALASRPDIKAASESLTAAQATRKGWNRELFPTVQIGASFGNQLSPTTQQYGPIPGCTPTVTNSCEEPIPRQGSPGFWQISATTTLSLPLVDYNQRHSERVSDDAQVNSAQMLLDQARTQAQIDVRQSYRAAQAALAQLAYAKTESQLGSESARIAQLQYAHGLITLADVIQTQEQAVVAESDLVGARVSYVDAVVKLRVSLGVYDAKSAVADLH